MAVIDRNKLLADESLWLPDSNVLTAEQMGQLNESVITSVGDDDTKYPEVLCKALKLIATANLAKAKAASGGLKREKVGDEEQEWFSPAFIKNVWEDYLDSLVDICPAFGYYGLRRTVGIKINTSTAPDINPCCGHTDFEY